jgi:hypothetical protein
MRRIHFVYTYYWTCAGGDGSRTHEITVQKIDIAQDQTVIHALAELLGNVGRWGHYNDFLLLHAYEFDRWGKLLTVELPRPATNPEQMEPKE